MIVKGTEKQILQMVANAVNAAVPVGMGFLHAESKKYTAEDFKLDSDGLSVDYFRGRMTKLTIRTVGEGAWALPDVEPREDYQSWSTTYPSYRALAETAGLEVIE